MHAEKKKKQSSDRLRKRERGRDSLHTGIVLVNTLAIQLGGSTVCGAERGKAVTVYKWWVVRASVSAYFPGPGAAHWVRGKPLQGTVNWKTLKG